MAGEIESYISSLTFNVNPVNEFTYNDKVMSTTVMMNTNITSKLNEQMLLGLLHSETGKAEALELLEKLLKKNHSKFVFQEMELLFDGLATALINNNEKITVTCTEVISQLIPHLGNDLDKHIKMILPLIISNIGSKIVPLHKESVCLLHLYLTHSLNIDLIFQVIANDGIKNKNIMLRKNFIYAFPSLLFAEYKDQNFFFIIEALIDNLRNSLIDHKIILNALEKVCDFVGRDVFNKYINHLSSHLQHVYYESSSKDVDELVNTKPNHIVFYSKGVNTSLKQGTPVNERFGNQSKDAGLSNEKHNNKNLHSNMSLNSVLTKSENESAHTFQLSFIPQKVLQELTSVDPNVKLNALDDFKKVLHSLDDSAMVKQNVVTLVSLLQTSIIDKNFRVAGCALQVIGIIISIIGSDLQKFTKLFVNSISKKLGNTKENVRSECYRLLFAIMDLCGFQLVLDMLFEKLQNKQGKVREDGVCFIIATLLTCKKNQDYGNINFEKICKNVAGCLTDSQSGVRQAALDCVAVLGSILGSTNKDLLSAIDKVELLQDNASGIMSAVQARLLRQQLPQLTENRIVEYAMFPPSTMPVGALQGADVRWVSAASKAKKGSNPMRIHASHDSKYLGEKKLETATASSMTLSHNKKLSSSGKNQFPWVRQEEILNSRPTNSAPATGIKTKNAIPPFLPKKNTWAPESELSTILTKNNFSKETKLSTQTEDSGYCPSFGEKGFQEPSGNSGLSDSSALSYSCPSSFFEKTTTTAARARRIKARNNQNHDSPRSTTYFEESASPIPLKPTLVRSASNRRENTFHNNKDQIKLDDSPHNPPVSLKNKSASPRFDQMLFCNSVEQTKPLLKPHHTVGLDATKDRLSSLSLNKLSDDVLSTPSPVSYTPSPLQKKMTKTACTGKIKTALKSSFILDKDLSIAKTDSFLSYDVNDNYDRSQPNPPSPRQIGSSHFKPTKHKYAEEVPDNVFNSIRRSAQNKRERMRSQPVSDDLMNESFTEYTTGSTPTKSPNSSLLTSSGDTFSQHLVESSSFSIIDDVPSLKYSPNTGKTFESKRVDSDVSVVGVGYPSNQGFTLLPSSGSTDIKLSRLTSGVSSPNSSNMAVLPNKFSPMTSSDRNKTHRGSTISSNTNSPEPSSQSFNIQGKGVFITSNNLLMTPSENSSSSFKEDCSFRLPKDDLSNSDSIIDGICGVAVGQRNGSPNESQKLPPTKISLSASFKEQKERREKRKEALNKNVSQMSKTLAYGEISSHSSAFVDDPLEDVFAGSSQAKSKATKFPSYSRNSLDKVVTRSVASSPSTLLIPLDNPEKKLTDATTCLATADSEDWESVTEAMYTIRRLATHHPTVLSSHFHDVITLLSKHVPSRRSQVSKASVQAVTDLYTHLKKPVVDIDLEATVRTLLLEHGKEKSFIKSEVSKSLQAVVEVATSSKVLNALLNTGLKHKNKHVRHVAAEFCSELVDKMGPGKALSGIKDTTDRLIEAIALFVTDGSNEVRQSARKIVSALMNHEDFSRGLDRYLTAENAQAVKNIASNIQQKGINPSSSIGLRKSSGRRRTSSSPLSAGSDRFLGSSGNPRVKTKTFNEQDREALVMLCDDLSKGGFKERSNAVCVLLDKLYQDRKFVEDNVVKIMSAYMTLLDTAQTKLNLLGLEHLSELITNLHSHFRDISPQLVKCLLRKTTSKQHGDLALQNIDLLVKHLDHLWIVQPFANTARHSDNFKEKQTAIRIVIKLIDNVARRKPQIIERVVLPVLWSLLSGQSAPSGIQLRKEIVELTRSVYHLLGRRLLEYSEAQNLTKKIKDILDL